MNKENDKTDFSNNTETKKQENLDETVVLPVMSTNLKDELTIDEEETKKEEVVKEENTPEPTTEEEKKVVDVPVVLTEHVLEAKKNNTPVIILVAIILVVIVIALAIATAVMNKTDKDDGTTLEEKCKKAYNCKKQLNGGYLCNYKSEENGEISEVICLAQYIEAEAPTTTKKIGQQVTTKENSLLNPAKKDTWLFASVYYVNENTKIPVKLTNITKGEEAEKIVNEVVNKGTNIPPLRNQDEEYVVIDYIIDGNGFNEYVSSKLNIYITRQYEETRTLEKDGKLYIPQVTYITNSQDTSGKNSTSRVVVNIPKDFNEYNIVIGEETNSKAYYQGE